MTKQQFFGGQISVTCSKRMRLHVLYILTNKTVYIHEKIFFPLIFIGLIMNPHVSHLVSPEAFQTAKSTSKNFILQVAGDKARNSLQENVVAIKMLSITYKIIAVSIFLQGFFQVLIKSLHFPGRIFSLSPFL